MKNIFLITLCSIFILSSCNNRHSSKFIHDSNETNKSCPIKISNNITLDSTHYSEDENKMSYYYSLSGELDNQEIIDKYYDKTKKELEESILNSVNMIEYQKKNVTIEYIYKSSSTKSDLAIFKFPLKYRSNRRR